MSRQQRENGSQEAGMVLIATLLLLVALSIISISSMLSSSIEIELAGNDRKTNIAMQFAEAGAERARDVLLPFFPYDGTAGTIKAPGADIIAMGSWNGDVDGDGTQDVNLTVANALATEPGRIMVRSQGIGPNNARAAIQVVLAFNQGTGGSHPQAGGGEMNQGNFQ